MRTFIPIASLLLLVTWLAVASAQVTRPTTETAATQPAIRFTWVDVYIDGGANTVAAYQIEFAAETGQAILAGIEGGDARAFLNPPYYDPKALMHGRVILGAYTTDANPPRGKTRVARLHLQVSGPIQPQFVAKLHVAADAAGQGVQAVVSLAEGAK